MKRQTERGKFHRLPNGVGMRFEGLILHAVGFFFSFLCN